MLKTDKWHHIVYTRDKKSAVQHLYLDGEKQAENYSYLLPEIRTSNYRYFRIPGNQDP